MTITPVVCSNYAAERAAEWTSLPFLDPRRMIVNPHLNVPLDLALFLLFTVAFTGIRYVAVHKLPGGRQPFLKWLFKNTARNPNKFAENFW